MKSFELVAGNSVFIHTNLAPKPSNDDIASRICGGYSHYALDDPDITVVFVRAADGQRLAKCGPGA